MSIVDYEYNWLLGELGMTRQGYSIDDLRYMYYMQ